MVLNKDDISRIGLDIEASSRDLNLAKVESLERSRKWRTAKATVFLLIYLILVSGMLTYFRDNRAFLIWPFKETGNLQERRLQDIESDIGLIKLLLASSTPTSLGERKLYNDLNVIRNRQSALEESISLDPEKALTAAMLRQKQADLEKRVDLLQEAGVRLESKLDNLILTAIILPMIGFLLWILQGFFKRPE